MSPEEAFRFGFMARCVEEGLSPAETTQRVEKLASFLEKQAEGESVWGTTKNLASGAGKLTLLAAGMVPAAAYGLGRGLGHLTASAVTDTPADYIERAKHEELTDEYDRRIQQLRKLREARGLSGKKKATGRRVGF